MPEIEFLQYRFKYRDLERNLPKFLTYMEGAALLAVAQGKSGETDPVLLRNLTDYGYIRKTEDGQYVPTILVMEQAKNPALPEAEQEKLEVLRNRAKEIIKEHYALCRDVIHQEIPEFLKDDAYQIDHACANMMNLRGAVLEAAISQGYLTVDETSYDRMLGASLTF